MTAELVEAVRTYAEWDVADGKGATKRDHLKQAGRKGPAVTVSVPLRYLLDWFFELDAGRGGNGFGLNPISFADIEAWSRLTGARPLPWEVRAIKAMDAALLGELAKRGD